MYCSGISNLKTINKFIRINQSVNFDLNWKRINNIQGSGTSNLFPRPNDILKQPSEARKQATLLMQTKHDEWAFSDNESSSWELLEALAGTVGNNRVQTEGIHFGSKLTCYSRHCFTFKDLNTATTNSNKQYREIIKNGTRNRRLIQFHSINLIFSTTLTAVEETNAR